MEVKVEVYFKMMLFNFNFFYIFNDLIVLIFFVFFDVVVDIIVLLLFILGF